MANGEKRAVRRGEDGGRGEDEGRGEGEVGGERVSYGDCKRNGEGGGFGGDGCKLDYGGVALKIFNCFCPRVSLQSVQLRGNYWVTSINSDSTFRILTPAWLVPTFLDNFSRSLECHN